MPDTNKTVFATAKTRGFFKVVITAGMVADAGLPFTTAESINLWGVVMELKQTKMSSRKTLSGPVIGNNNPIVIAEEALSEKEYEAALYYTKGKETVGTDLLDPYSDIILPLFLNSPQYPVQFIWSIGGLAGDEQVTTSATDTYITTVPDPVVGGSGFSMVPFKFVTASTVIATIA